MTPLHLECRSCGVSEDVIAYFLIRHCADSVEDVMDHAFKGDEAKFFEDLLDMEEEYYEENGAFGVGA